MEMKKFLLNIILTLIFASCSNSPEMETGEIKTLQLLKQAFNKSNNAEIFVDARDLLSREQVDRFNTPVLFVELASGQNGTLTPYPGRGIGQTWLGADGATVTTDQGILKATRGMGDDIMGSISDMPKWSKINSNTLYYRRTISYLSGNNKITEIALECSINKENKREFLRIWNVEFQVNKFHEVCYEDDFHIKNTYYVDEQNIVRQSSQYHSKTLGYIKTERLDR